MLMTITKMFQRLLKTTAVLMLDSSEFQQDKSNVNFVRIIGFWTDRQINRPIADL